jgi:integrase
VQGDSYRKIVADFIELYAKPHQRSWHATERTLLKSVPKEWLDCDINSITRRDVLAMVDQLVKDGHGPKAQSAVAWLRKLWRWCFEREIVPAPIMDAVKVRYQKRPRDRVYSDEEIKNIWRAADQLPAVESAYVKLLVLLAPRKTALVAMRWEDIENGKDFPIWKTPHEFTKSRKTSNPSKCYFTPLPPLAQHILEGLPHSDQRVFPSLLISQTPAGQSWFDGGALTKRLIKNGAPKDFSYHACRHTLATWLQNEGHSEWERGLVLNHSGTGSVTAGYSHGYPLKLKLELLEKWADHVERLVERDER